MSNIYENYKSLSVHVKASMWFLICSVMQKGITVLTTPIFTRLLSTFEYGQFQVFNSWMSIVSVFVTLKLFYGFYTQGLVKYSERNEVFSSALQGLTLTLVSTGLIFFLVFNSFWSRVFSLSFNQLIALIIMCWTDAVFQFWATEQRVFLNYKKLVAVSLMAAFFKPLIGVLLVINCEDKVSARIWGLAAVEFIFYFPMFVSQLKKGRVFYDKGIWKYALTFAVPLIPHYLAQSFLIDSDKIMIGKMVNTDSAGIYGLAYSVAQIMTLFNTALLQTISPWMYRQIKDNNTVGIKNVIHPAMIIIAALNSVLVCFAPEVISIFAPKEYYDAIWVVQPIAISVFLTFSYSVFANFEFYFEKTKFVTFATSIAALSNIILNYIFIPVFGYYAAGYTTLFGYLLYAVLHYRYMSKICKSNSLERPCHLRFFIIVSSVFMIVCFAITVTYRFVIVRYVFFVSIILLMIICRKGIVQLVKKIRGRS